MFSIEIDTLESLLVNELEMRFVFFFFLSIECIVMLSHSSNVPPSIGHVSLYLWLVNRFKKYSHYLNRRGPTSCVLSSP